MTNRRIIFVTVLLMCACMVFADGAYVKSDLYPQKQSFNYASQLGLYGQGGTQMPANAALRAVGTPEYCVRPGDVYLLSYYDGTKIINETVQIDSNYRASVSNIGSINAKGQTYMEFKTSVENQVKTFYPYAKPNLTLQSCGLFTVNVAGEVVNTTPVTVWGLTRLSDLANYATEYASTREIIVTTQDGKTNTYDLYAAIRNGEDKQNPYLEPGSTVTFTKADVTVSLSGAVQRPGVYQPKEGETLETVIAAYGNGFTNKADTTMYTVSRYTDGTLVTDIVPAAKAAGYELKFGDSVAVAEKINTLPYVEVQGAVADGRIFYQYFKGETVEHLVETLTGHLKNQSGAELQKDADISGIYAIRNGEMLDFDSELQDGDILVVPYLNNNYVTVSGAVRTPGKFMYVPGEDVSYYIAQAGGYEENARRTSTRIYSAEGETIDTLQPNCVIDTNYKIAASTVALASSIVALVLSCIELIGAFTK